MAETVVIVGGGWAGCAAAVGAARALGARGRAVLLERTDMLLGLGLAGGIFRNNGRYTAAEEGLQMGGGGRLFAVMDGAARHRMLDFPGHRHASLYDIVHIEPDVRACLEEEGVEVVLQARVTAAEKRAGRVREVAFDGERIGAAAFVDATGSAGPPGNCTVHGSGCAMCALRCPSFGPRVALCALAGVRERPATRSDGGLGSMSGSCDLLKDSLEPWLRRELEDKGVAVLTLPDELSHGTDLGRKACQQYNLPEFGRNLVLLDTGTAKMMASHFPLSDLRRLPGLARARYEDPAAGGVSNSVRFMALVRHDAALRVTGLGNVFCAGEKAGPLVGHTEAVATGMLAGYNAARAALGLAPVAIDRRSTATGDLIACATSAVRRGRLTERLTFSGAGFFRRMVRRGLYTTDRQAVHERVRQAGLAAVFDRPVG